MTVHVALLRAVNLGARNKVPMAALRVALETAGLPGARTLLQSGNVVVKSDLDVGPITFLAEHPSPEQARLLETHDDVRLQGREVYIDYRDRVHGNPINTSMAARRLSQVGTERNWATVLKLAGLAALY